MKIIKLGIFNFIFRGDDIQIGLATDKDDYKFKLKKNKSKQESKINNQKNTH